MGDFAFDNFGWAESNLGPIENLRTIVEDPQQVGVPIDFAPFKHNNGDYFCFTESGGVQYGITIQIWLNKIKDINGLHSQSGCKNHSKVNETQLHSLRPVLRCRTTPGGDAGVICVSKHKMENEIEYMKAHPSVVLVIT